MPLDLIVKAQDLFEHMAWADALVCQSVLGFPAAAADPKTCELLQHYSITQRAFLALWRQTDLDFRALMTEPRDAAATAASMQRYYAQLFEWIGGLDAGTQHQPLVVPWAEMLEQRLGRRPEHVTIGESMVQVAMHSAHHRAQVSQRVRQLGGEPPLVDFIAWAWIGRPTPVWPAESVSRG